MAEHGELAGEVVVDADDLFLEVRRGIVAADEGGISVAVGAVALGENTCSEQGSGVLRNHALWDRVVREGLTLHDSRGCQATRAIAKEHGKRNSLIRGRYIDDRGTKIGVTGCSVWVKTAAGNMLVSEIAPE